MNRYKNETFNTPEQKVIELAIAHKNALDKIESLEARIKELEKENAVAVKMISVFIDKSE